MLNAGVEALSAGTGVPVPALRLLLTLLATYPLGALYRALFLHAPKTGSTSASLIAWPRHVFCLVTGLALAYFNYGLDVWHLVFAVVTSWLLLRFLGPTRFGAGTVALFAFGYLLHGYWQNATDDYDINWTTSYCVTTLRLIGFAMDYYDGHKQQRDTDKQKQAKPDALKSSDSKSPNTTRSALNFSWDRVGFTKLPSLLETLGYCFYFGGVIVGPQFPFAIYKKFVTMELFRVDPGAGEENDKKVDAIYVVPSGASAYALYCFGVGAFYMALTQVGQLYFPISHVVTSEFAVEPFWWRLVYVAFAGKTVLHRYIGVWLVNEGGCVLSGITYKGVDAKTQRPLWNGLTNVEPVKVDGATSFLDIIAGFNMNTNLWVKQYVFKRLRFLGNKTLSGLGALLFLAIWHGFSPAYFFSFTIEFADVEAERILHKLLLPIFGWMYDRSDSKRHASAAAIIGRTVSSAVCFLLIWINVSYGTVAFDLLTWSRVKSFADSMFWMSHIGCAVVFLLTVLMPKRRHKVKEQ